MNSELIKLIKNIISKPGVFGVNRVEDIHFIVLGYSISNDQLSESKSFFLGYQNYLVKHFSLDGNYEWHRIIRLFCSSDQHSLQIMNDTFNEYVEEAL